MYIDKEKKAITTTKVIPLHSLPLSHFICQHHNITHYCFYLQGIPIFTHTRTHSLRHTLPVPSRSPPRSERWAGRSSAPPWGGGRAAAGPRPAGCGSAQTDAPPGSPPRLPPGRGGGTGQPRGTAPGSSHCSAPAAGTRRQTGELAFNVLWVLANSKRWHHL